jgi:methionyl-tRNA formyltransferase
MRVAFFGTPAFAVPTFERIAAGPHALVIAVTQPDRPRGRGRRVEPGPVAAAARRASVPLLQPEDVGAPDVVGALAASRPDVGVVVAFGQFLPKRVRELPARGFLVNAHASLLPRHRGAAPIQHAILCGDRETGVCAMRVEREMDAGPVAVVKRTPIGATENAGELSERLARLAADAIAEALDGIAGGRIQWAPQEAARATLAPKLSPADQELDFREPAEALSRRVRALAPRPGARAHLDGVALRVLAAHAEPGGKAAPGTLVREGDQLRAATADGWLALDRLQRPGGRALPTAELLRGFALPAVAAFAVPPPALGAGVRVGEA